MLPIPLGSNPDGVTIPVLVVPGASRREVVGVHGDRLRVRVTAPPEKGRASEEGISSHGSFVGLGVEGGLEGLEDTRRPGRGPGWQAHLRRTEL